MSNSCIMHANFKLATLANRIWSPAYKAVFLSLASWGLGVKIESLLWMALFHKKMGSGKILQDYEAQDIYIWEAELGPELRSTEYDVQTNSESLKTILRRGDGKIQLSGINSPTLVKSIYFTYRWIYCINVIGYCKLNQPQCIKLLTSEWPHMTFLWLSRRDEQEVIKRWLITDIAITLASPCLTSLPNSLEGTFLERTVVSHSSSSWPLFRSLQRKLIDWLCDPYSLYFLSLVEGMAILCQVPWY